MYTARLAGLSLSGILLTWCVLTPKKIPAIIAWFRLAQFHMSRSSAIRFSIFCALLFSLAARRKRKPLTTFGVSFLLAWWTFYRLFVVEHARAKFQPNPFNTQVAERAALTFEIFAPTPWAFAAPGQTITCLGFSGLLDRWLGRGLEFQAEQFVGWDTNFQVLHWVSLEVEQAVHLSFKELNYERLQSVSRWGVVNETSNSKQPTPIVLLIHGFGESRFHPPVKRFSRRARELGWKAVVWSYWRWDFGETRDLADVIKHISSSNPGSPILAVAWSAGAFTMLKYLEEFGDSTGLAAAVVLSPLMDPLAARELCRETQNKIYSIYLNHLAKIALTRHIKSDRTLSDDDRLRLNKLTDTFADAFELYDRFLLELPGGFSGQKHTPSLIGPDNNTYVKPSLKTLGHYRPTTYGIDRIRIPTLFVHADDDPVVAGHLNDWDELVSLNPYLFVVTTQRGGHEGHYTGMLPGADNTWDLRVACRFLSAVLETQAEIQHVRILIKEELDKVK